MKGYPDELGEPDWLERFLAFWRNAFATMLGWCFVQTEHSDDAMEAAAQQAIIEGFTYMGRG